jgi:hypothetical protein
LFTLLSALAALTALLALLTPALLAFALLLALSTALLTRPLLARLARFIAAALFVTTRSITLLAAIVLASSLLIEERFFGLANLPKLVFRVGIVALIGVVFFDFLAIGFSDRLLGSIRVDVQNLVVRLRHGNSNSLLDCREVRLHRFDLVMGESEHRLDL